MKKNIRGRRFAMAARGVCEAIESRRYFSVTLGTPNTLTVTGAHTPMDAVFLEGSSSPSDLVLDTPGAVQILIGNNDGTFNIGNAIALPANPATIKPFLVGDFSGSGTTDIALLSTAGVGDGGGHEGLLTYETNNSDGSFTEGNTSTITNNGVGFTPITGITNDYNADGDTDAAVLGEPDSGSELVLAIMQSNGDGTFSEVGDYNVTGSNAAGTLSTEAIFAANLGNGNEDIILYDGSSGNLDIFMNTGSGAFTQLAPVALTATHLTDGIFTSGGNEDLVVANGAQLTTLLGNGDGTFTAQTPVTMGGTISAITGADFDNDGNRDIVTNLGVQLGNGDGTFQSPIALPGLGGDATFANDLLTGDTNHDGRLDIIGFSSAGNTVASVLNTTPAVTSVDVESNDNPASPGDDVQYSATVSSQLNGTPGGSVEFFDGSTDLGSGTLVGGTATFDAGTGLSIGSHSITAQYGGSARFAPSTSDPTIQTVLAPTTITLTSSENPSNIGDDVTFTANVTGNDGSGDVPTGDVEFFDNTVDIGSGSLDDNGNATFDTASLSVATHQITAEYESDDNFASSTTISALNQTINETALVPVVASTTVPAALVIGGTITARAIVDLTNETGSTITGPATVTLFASTNGLIDGSASVVASLPIHSIKVAASATAAVNVTIKLKPISLDAGSYMLLAQVSYNSGAISNATTGPAFTVASPFIAFADVLTVAKLPAAIVRGVKTPAVVTIKTTNNGNVTSTGPVTVALSASTEQGVAGTPIISVTKTLSIKPGASKSVTIPLKNIPSLADGNYFIVAQTTDPDDNTSVASTATAVTAAAPFASLAASVGAVKPSALAPGKSGNFVVTITNNGNINATGPMTFDVEVSADGETIAGSLLELMKTITIAPGTSKTVMLKFPVATTATAGPVFPAVAISQNGVDASAIGVTPVTVS